MTEELEIKIGLDAGGAMDGFKKLMHGIGGLRSALAGMAVVAAGAFAFNAADDLQKDLLRARANSRDATISLEELGNAVGRVSDSLKGAFTQGQVGEALAGVANEAGSAQEALLLVEAAGRLAAVTGRDLGGVSSNLADVLSAFGLSAGSAAGAANALFVASRETGTGLETLAESVRSSAQYAQALGLDFNETAALAGVLKDAGVDSANALLSAWTKAGGKGGIQGLIDEIRAKAQQAAASSRTVGDVMAEAFGKGGVAALALLNGSDALADVIAKTRTDTEGLAVAIDGVITPGQQSAAEFDKLKTKLGQELLPVVNQVLGGFAGFTRFLTATPARIDGLVAAIQVLTAAFLVYKAGVIGATMASIPLSVALSPILIVVVAIAAAVAASILAFKSWNKSIEETGSGFGNFAKGLAVIWDNIKAVFFGALDWVTSLFSGIGAFIGGLVSDFKQWGGDIVSGLWDGIKAKWSAMVAWFTDAWDGIKDRFKNVFGIHSPSSVFMGYGENIVEGFAKGIQELDVVAANKFDAIPLPSTSTRGSSSSQSYGDFHVTINARDASDMEAKLNDWWLNMRRTGGYIRG